MSFWARSSLDGIRNLLCITEVRITFLRISLEPQSVLNVSAANLTPPRIFEFLATDCKPIAAKSRRYNREDSDFIKSEVSRLFDAGIIEPARSPWRAQVLVVHQSNGKKRLCVDYSVTINRYTYLDAYPLPRINDVVSKVAQDTFYSSLDLKSAYHQVPFAPEERPMTALGQMVDFFSIVDYRLE